MLSLDQNYKNTDVAKPFLNGVGGEVDDDDVTIVDESAL
jgi:hypothetical protein